ncbi:MAG: thioredoxin fold domain-containing protein [Chitinophagales bacterium]
MNHDRIYHPFIECIKRGRLPSFTKINLLRILFSIYLLSFVPEIAAQNQEVSFLDTEMTWEELVFQAQKERKLLFIYLFEPNCPNCSQAESGLFTDPQIAAKHNRYFINYKINGADERIKDFISTFEVDNYPSFLFFNKNSQLLQKRNQAPSTLEYLELIKELVSDEYGTPDIGRQSQTPSSKFDNGIFTIPSPNYNDQPSDTKPPKPAPSLNQQKKYADMKRLAEQWEKSYYNKAIQPKELRLYAYWLKSQNQSYHAPVNDYLKTQKGQFQHPLNRQFIFDFSETVENDAIQLFMNDIHHFKTTQGSESINSKLKQAIYNSILTAIEEHDKAIFKNAIDIINQANLPFKDNFEFEMTMLYCKGMGEWKEYAEKSISYINSKNITDPKLLNDLASDIALNLEDARYLEQALEWAKMSVKMENEYDYNHTLTFVYYRLGQYDMAMKMAEYTLKLAELRKVNPTKIKNLIDDIRTRR